jgi:ribosome-associated protein
MKVSVVMQKTIEINTEYITLGQALKIEAIIHSGGIAKLFLEDVEVLVNGEREMRRGRKLYDGDEITIADIGSFIVRR